MLHDSGEEPPHTSPFRFRGGAAGAIQPFCSWRLRLESQGILARELAAAARRGLPLDAALEVLATPQRRVPRWFLNASLGGGLMFFALGYGCGGIGAGIAAFLLLFLLPILMLGFSISSDDYLHKLCRTLQGDLQRGFSLSGAMRRHPELFDAFELSLVESGERSGRLADSLDSLAAHSRGLEELRHTIAMALYPLILAGVGCAVIFFILIQIIPKYQDIFNQLGLDQVPGHYIIAHLGNWAMHGLFPVLAAIAASFLFLWILPRVFFNGSSAASLLYHAIAALALSIALGAFFIEATNTSYSSRANENWEHAIGGAFVALSLPLGMAIVYAGSRLGRRFSGMGMGKFAWAVDWIPGLRAAFRRFGEAKFLLALGCQLDAGREWPEALEEAGNATGASKWRRDAQSAANRARQGEKPEDALNHIKLMFPASRASLRLALPKREGMLNLLREIACEDGLIGRRELSRFNSWFFPFVHLLEGAAVAFFLVLTYLPLFVLPIIAGFSRD